MKGFGERHKSKNKSINKIKPPKEQIIKQAIQFHLNGNIPEAAKYYQYCINQGFDDPQVFSNYAGILRLSGKLKEAEVLLHKAIELKPDYPQAHFNLGCVFNYMGKPKNAEASYLKAIELNPKNAESHYSLGKVLSDLEKLQESELSYLKAIELNPNYINAHFNLGNVFSNLGKLQEAELSYLKTIELNPNYIKAYYALSLLKYSDQKKIWNNLFSENILNHKSNEDKILIYFARANILHNEKNYEKSSKFFKLANQLKLSLHPSNSSSLINNSKKLLIESIKQKINQKENSKLKESIFIVGMPRSGSTLLESILSMNAGISDLGESKLLKEAFLDYKKSNQKLDLGEIYLEKIKNHTQQSNITTNKNLYNYVYAGFIASKIPNSKIIHCYRNPLDNICSIYRTNFRVGNQYSTSLIDCANIYLNHEEIMSKYKNKFRSKIYDLNYDSLVCNPKEEIKSLISWLGWKWSDAYLSPHLNSRIVYTASKVQVRSPINAKSLGGWKNYKDMLRPAMEIITQKDKYKDLKY